MRPHDHAVPPACAHFGHCGGCSLQSLAYERQLAAKAEIVLQAIQRVGKVRADASRL